MPITHHGDDHGHAHAAGHAAVAKHDDHAHHEHGHGSHFHPHAPGWAINTVLSILAVCSILAAGLYLRGDHGGWVASMVHHSTAVRPEAHAAAHAGAVQAALHAAAHGTFLGMDPHAVMYYVSAAIGLTGIGIAFSALPRTHHRRSQPRRRPRRRPGPHRRRRPAQVVCRRGVRLPHPHAPVGPGPHLPSHRQARRRRTRRPLWGRLPRLLGKTIRPAQSGVLHGYALGMAGGLAVILLIVLLVVT